MVEVCFAPEGSHNFLENFFRILPIVENLVDGGEEEAVVSVIKFSEAGPVSVVNSVDHRRVGSVIVGGVRLGLSFHEVNL